MAYVQISTQNCKNQALYMQEMIKIYSFDIFDTLLLRPYTDPQEIWNILEEQENCKGFAKFRKEADEKTYATATREDRETTIEEAYSIMPHKYQALMKKEIELERKVLCANPEMLEKWEKAKSEGKKCILVSDMYLPQEIIEDILIEKGIRGWDALYLSRTYNARKTTGKLFEIMLKEEGVEPNEVLHIGDNIHSDVKIPKSLGISTCQYEKISDQLYKAFPFTKYINQRLTGCIALGYHKYTYSKIKKNEITSYWNNLGFIIGGIFGYMYVKWIVEVSRKKGKERILFIGRDGYILKKICNTLYPDINTEYIYAPRIVSIATLGAIGTDKQAVEDRKKYLKEHLTNSICDELKTEYTEYAKNLNITESTCIVDGCSSAFSAQRLLESCTRRKVFCFYMMAMSKLHNAAALISTEPHTVQFQNLLEFIFGAPTPPTVKVSNNHPVYETNIPPFEKFKISVTDEIAEGALFCAIFLKENNIQIHPSCWIDYTNQFMSNLTPVDKTNLLKVRNACDIQHEKIQSLIWTPYTLPKRKITRIGRFSIKIELPICDSLYTLIISRTHCSFTRKDIPLKRVKYLIIK